MAAVVTDAVVMTVVICVLCFGGAWERRGLCGGGAWLCAGVPARERMEE